MAIQSPSHGVPPRHTPSLSSRALSRSCRVGLVDLRWIRSCQPASCGGSAAKLGWWCNFGGCACKTRVCFLSEERRGSAVFSGCVSAAIHKRVAHALWPAAGESAPLRLNPGCGACPTKPAANAQTCLHRRRIDCSEREHLDLESVDRFETAATMASKAAAKAAGEAVSISKVCLSPSCSSNARAQPDMPRLATAQRSTAHPSVSP